MESQHPPAQAGPEGTEERPMIRPIADSDSITELTELLHRAYKRLADMGFRFFASHQNEEQTRERINDGRCVVVEMGGRIVGTITSYRCRHDASVELYRRSDVAHFGQFAVEPVLQGHGIGSMLIDLVESEARAEGMVEMALDTSEGATHLIEYYARRGYEVVGYTQWNVTNYRSVIMSKKL